MSSGGGELALRILPGVGVGKMPEGGCWEVKGPDV